MNDIFNRVQEVQRFEQNCFIEKLNKYIENNCYNFNEPYPKVAGYILGEPINIKIKKALLINNKLKFIGINKVGDDVEIDPDDIFVGQLDFLIDFIDG